MRGRPGPTARSGRARAGSLPGHGWRRQAPGHVTDQRHATQLRHSCDPYITHPLAVATILAELGMDTTTLVAALLHDTVEDTGYTLDALSEDFGEEVGHLVDGVTKLDRVVLGTFELEWPRGSGRIERFPELDRLAWCAPELARDRLIAGQREFLDRLADHLLKPHRAAASEG